MKKPTYAVTIEELAGDIRGTRMVEFRMPEVVAQAVTSVMTVEDFCAIYARKNEDRTTEFVQRLYKGTRQLAARLFRYPN